jgi:hypothetical protein
MVSAPPWLLVCGYRVSFLSPRTILLMMSYRLDSIPTRTPRASAPSLSEVGSQADHSTSTSKSAAAATAQNQALQTTVRSSEPFQPQSQLQYASAPEHFNFPRPLYVEDPAQRRARETAPRMNTAQALALAARTTARTTARATARASEKLHPTASWPTAPVASQPLSFASASVQAAALQAQRTHVPLPYIPPPAQAAAAPLPRVRKGYWNRRGDHLTSQGYIVVAPKEHQNPFELAAYPTENQGFRNHLGMVANNPGYRELPDSRAPGVYEKVRSAFAFAFTSCRLTRCTVYHVRVEMWSMRTRIGGTISKAFTIVSLLHIYGVYSPRLSLLAPPLLIAVFC